MATAVQRQPSTPLDRLILSEQWTRLTQPQRRWVTEFIASADPVKATRLAYRCKSEESARVYSYEIRRHPAVRAAVAVFNGKSQRDLLIEDLRENIRKSKPGSIARTKSLALLARLTLGVDVEMDGRLASHAGESAEAPAEAHASTPDTDRKVPAGALAWINKDGVVIGYRDADGKDVQL
jgi:hypothetical protein